MSVTDRQQRWRAANRERAEDTRRAYAGRPEVQQRRRDQYAASRPGRPKIMEGDWRSRNYAHHLFLRCRAKAKRAGLPFDLTLDLVKAMVAPMRCAVTGARLVIAPQGQRHPLLPSVDQIEPGKGYVAGNVRIVSWVFNRAKGAGTDGDVLEMALALVRQSATHSLK